MRENRTCGSEGGEGLALPDPYHIFGVPAARSLLEHFQFIRLQPAPPPGHP